MLEKSALMDKGAVKSGNFDLDKSLAYCILVILPDFGYWVNKLVPDKCP